MSPAGPAIPRSCDIIRAMTGAALKGLLLVANPSLRGPNFDRAVVLVLTHEDTGALGVILNRPSEIALGVLLPGWDEVAAEPAVVFQGGPVAPSAAIGLARAAGEPALDGWEPLFGRFGTVDLERRPVEVAPPVQAVRVFAGYAGWGPGQLEAEIEAGGWFVLESLPDDPLSAEAASLWSTVLRRQGGDLAMLATFPPDPSLN